MNRGTPGSSLAGLKPGQPGWSLAFPFRVILFLGMASDSWAALSPEAVEFFEDKIRPVLAQDCYECHR